MRPQYFCYVYDLPEATPLMFPLEADTLPDAVSEARQMITDDRSYPAFAEIWDGLKDSVVTRVDPPIPEPTAPGLLRSLRRVRPS